MPSAPPSPPHRHRLLLGGIAVPVALIGSMLAAGPASAAGSTETTKAGLVAAMQTATNGYVLTLGRDLVGDGGASDVLTVPSNRSVTLNLSGHRLELDQLVVGSSSNLFLADATDLGAAISLGTGSVAATEHVVTGASVATNSRLEIENAVQLTATGSADRPGVGTTSASDVNAVLYIDDGATVDATGGAHGAGIGGGEGAVPLSTVSIGNAIVHATGGAGAAGIGGGVGSTGAGSSVSVENGDVTVADGGLASDAAGSLPPMPSAPSATRPPPAARARCASRRAAR
jgi:hypothetical protein